MPSRCHPLLVAAACALSMGCVHRLTPKVTSPTVRGAPRELRATLVLPRALESRSDSWGRFTSLGLAHEWICNTGLAFAPAMEDTVRAVFRDVRLVRELPSAPDSDVVLVPDLVEVRSNDGFDFRVVVRIHVLATDGYGQTLWDRLYEQEESGDTQAAIWSGALAGQAALADPTGRAMSRILERFAADLARIEPAPPPQL